jgi:hypothetical protein
MHFFVGLPQPPLYRSFERRHAGCGSRDLEYVGPDADLPDPEISQQLHVEARQYHDLHMVNHVDSYFNVSAKILGEVIWAHTINASWVLLLDIDDASRQTASTLEFRVEELHVRLAKHHKTPLLIGNYMTCLSTANHMCMKGKFATPMALQTSKLDGPYAKLPPIPWGGDSMGLNRKAIELLLAPSARCYHPYSDHAIGLWAHHAGVVPHSWSWKAFGQQHCKLQLEHNFEPVTSMSWRCANTTHVHWFEPSTCFCDPNNPEARGALAPVTLVPL